MKKNKYWLLLKLWFIPHQEKMCRGCCLFCTYQDKCLQEFFLD